MYSAILRPLITNFIIQALSLILTILIVPGFIMPIGTTRLIAVIFVYFLLNTLIRPIIWYLTLPLNVITLGLFTLVINALILLATAWISDLLDFGFYIKGFLILIVGALTLSIIRMIMNKTLQSTLSSRLFNKDLKWIKELEKAISWLEKERDYLVREILKRQEIIEENDKIIKRLGKNNQSSEK